VGLVVGAAVGLVAGATVFTVELGVGGAVRVVVESTVGLGVLSTLYLVSEEQSWWLLELPLDLILGS
jgi:hypothetical protein